MAPSYAQRFKTSLHCASQVSVTDEEVVLKPPSPHTLEDPPDVVTAEEEAPLIDSSLMKTPLRDPAAVPSFQKRSTGFPPFTGKPSLRIITHRLDRTKKLRLHHVTSGKENQVLGDTSLPQSSASQPPEGLPDIVEDEKGELEEGEIPFLPSPAAENFFKLKSRIRWLKEGDSNTKFFHRVVLANQSWNAIRYLRDSSGLRIYNQQQLKGMAGAYFKNLLGSESRGIEPMSVEAIRRIHPFRCSPELALELISIPSDEEITAAFLKMPKSKAPGPDGFPAEFFADAWDIVGEESILAVKEFFISGRMLRKFNATTIALLPKVTDNFWTLDPARSGSWMWKDLCKLRPLARPFVVCEVGSGITASFWHENWTSLGSLYQLTDGRGPSITGLSEGAVVRDALVNGNWWLSSSRSRNPVIGLVKNSLPDHQHIVDSEVDDCFLWKVGNDPPKSSFSNSLMWAHLYDNLPAVPWHNLSAISSSSVYGYSVVDHGPFS
ncbi:zf-RVT domain-containing protein [Hirschfeldia incana]|nr:zf-RVT domain-containing protein [Hirschfeldia incana]